MPREACTGGYSKRLKQPKALLQPHLEKKNNKKTQKNTKIKTKIKQNKTKQKNKNKTKTKTKTKNKKKKKKMLASIQGKSEDTCGNSKWGLLRRTNSLKLDNLIQMCSANVEGRQNSEKSNF